MELALIAIFATACLFLAMLVFSEIGRRIGLAKITKASEESLAKGTGAAEAAVFGLLALLIAFTFSGAASRFEDRRHLITKEANAIGTAYLRIDLLPAADQPEIRNLFRRYVDARLETYQDVQDMVITKKRLAATATLQGEIWSKALNASRSPNAPAQATMLLLPALNEMIDITTTRTQAAQNHPPMAIFLLLGGVCLIGALLIGYGTSPNKDRSWFHTMIFAAMLSLTVYVIVDLEFPRVGLIQVGDSDQVLIDLRKSIE